MSATILMLAIPGQPSFYMVARSLDQGCKAGLSSAFGIATGGLVLVLVATFGL